MIDVTRRAAIEIRSLLTHSKHSRASAGHVLRLTFDGKSGIAMVSAFARPGFVALVR